MAFDTLLSLVEILLTSSVARERGEIISSMVRLAIDDLLAEVEAKPDTLSHFFAVRVTRAAEWTAQIHPTPDNRAWALEVTERIIRLAQC